MQDTNKENKQERKHFKGCFSLPVLLVLGLLCLLFSYLLIQGHQKRLDLQATETAERSLTIEHGDEAREAIDRFEMNWSSFAMHKDPESFYSSLLVGPMLEHYEGHNGYGENEIWYVQIFYSLGNIRVISYSSQQIKVIACYEEQFGKFDHNGNLLEENSTVAQTRYYVFQKDNSVWKLAGSIDLTIPHMAEQEWTYMSQDYKNLFGDIYSILDKDCFGDK